MNKYSNFFTDIVANHLHKLVDLVQGSSSKKVLVHQWVLGIEYNWRAYAGTSENESEFIGRLSFWIGGLRDKFNANPSKKEVIHLLYKIFDASTFCYFEYNARTDIKNQIENFCNEVDNWFNENILKLKFKKFELSQKVIPLINDMVEVINKYGKKEVKFKISRDIHNASELEAELSKFITQYSEIILELIKNNPKEYENIKVDLESIITLSEKLDFKKLLSDKFSKKIEIFDKLIFIRNLEVDTTSIMKGNLNYDLRNFSLIYKFDIKINIDKEIKKNLHAISELLINNIMKNPDKFDFYFNLSVSIDHIWVQTDHQLFNHNQKIMIEKLKNITQIRKIVSDTILLIKKELDLEYNNFPLTKNININMNLDFEINSILKLISKSLFQKINDYPDKYDEYNKIMLSIINLWKNTPYHFLNVNQEKELIEIRKLVKKRELLILLIDSMVNQYRMIDISIEDARGIDNFSHFFNLKLNRIKEKDVIKSLLLFFKKGIDTDIKNSDALIYVLNLFFNLNQKKKKFNFEIIKQYLDKVNKSSILKIILVNIFEKPLINTKVSIINNNKEIKSGETNQDGEILFNQLPREEFIIQINGKKEILFIPENYYNEYIPKFSKLMILIKNCCNKFFESFKKINENIETKNNNQNKIINKEYIETLFKSKKFRLTWILLLGIFIIYLKYFLS
jgi:hypothetical protein